MEEFLIVSHNFKMPVDIVVSGRHVSGMVDQLDEDGNALIAGAWYPIGSIEGYDAH